MRSPWVFLSAMFVGGTVLAGYGVLDRNWLAQVAGIVLVFSVLLVVWLASEETI